MNFSVPHNALVVIADGTHATFYRNTGTSDIKIEKLDTFSPVIKDGRGPSRVPNEISPHEIDEANFAKHLADALYERLHDKGHDAVVIIADPQTLGQIRPHLHKEVTARITGELHKTLTKASIAEIEKILTTALS